MYNKSMKASNIANAKSEIGLKNYEIKVENEDNKFTGYIDEFTELYVESYEGISIEEFYEEYIENKYPGYDADIEVDREGTIISIEIE